jgi:hypothetical protein
MENISTDKAASSPPEEPSWLVRCSLPIVDKQSSKRAVEIGALIGFFLPLLCGLVSGIMSRPTDWSFGRLLGGLLLLLCAGVFCGVFGAFGGAAFVLILRPFADLLARLFGRKDDSPVLPPHSALAKTDALERHRPYSSVEETGIIAPQQSDRFAITDGDAGIQSEDA